ncbi:unnamed protein product, partial [Brachionus calyciflorus]
MKSGFSPFHSLRKDLVEEATKVYWRCEFYNQCRGRGISNGLQPSFKNTLPHNSNHQNRPEDKEKLYSKQKLLEIATSSNEQPRAVIIIYWFADECISLFGKKGPIRRQIIRTRNREFGYNKNPQLLSELEIL